MGLRLPLMPLAVFHGWGCDCPHRPAVLTEGETDAYVAGVAMRPLPQGEGQALATAPFSLAVVGN